MGGTATILLFALAAGALVVAGAGVRLLQADLRLRHRLSPDGPRRGSVGLRLALPRPLLARGTDRREIERDLREAGQFGAGALDRFVWLRIAATMGVTLATFAVMRIGGAGGFPTFLAIVIAAGLTYLGAKHALKRMAAKRERRLTAEFPFLLDLMLMMLESGVSLDQCFRALARDERAAVPHHAPLVAMLVEDLDRGQDYQTALDRWAKRVAVFGAKELATLFRQSLFQGMELAPALREFIVEFSHRRVARAREAIGRITVRMVVLMLVFFMPALFVVLAGPPVAAIFDTLRSAAQ